MKILIIIALIPAFLAAGTYDIEKIKNSVRDSSKLKIEAEEFKIGCSEHTYHIHASNASSKMAYALIGTNLLNHQDIMTEDARIDQNGVVIFKDRLMPFCVQAQNVGPGEPIFIHLISNDRREIASTKIVPHPISTQAHGYKFSIEMGDAFSMFFCYQAAGYEPCEEIILISRSASEVLKHNIKADVNGVVEGLISPAVIGADLGIAKLELIGKKGSVSLEYHWGPVMFAD